MYVTTYMYVYIYMWSSSLDLRCNAWIYVFRAWGVGLKGAGSR